MTDKKVENKQVKSLVKITPVKDYAYNEEDGVTLWGIHFEVVGENLVAEEDKELVASLIEAGHVKEL